MDRSDITTYRPAWASYWKAWLAVAALAASAYAFSQVRGTYLDTPTQRQEIAPLVGLAPALLIIAGVLFHRYTRAYQIESGRRLRTTIGFIARDRREFLISDKIQTDLKQTVLSRLLGYGTLRFWTGDDQSGQSWVNVAAPNRLEAEIKALALSTDDAARKPSRTAANARTEKPNFHLNPTTLTIPPLPKPPAGTIFANHAVILPRFPSSFVRHIGSLDTAVEPQQFVTKGEPLLTLTLMTEDEKLFGGGKVEDVVIPAPVSGLVLRRSHFASRLSHETALNPADEMRATLLPVEGESVENGAFIFGALCNAMWKHRDFLFRRQKKLKEISKHSPGSAQWVATWADDNTIREALDKMLTQACDEIPARPAFDDYLCEAWIKRPYLRDFLAPFVDESALRKVNTHYKLEQPEMVNEAIRTHRETLHKLAGSD
ncbi:PH domain-containing protein [Hyphococcus luteus]|uniref:YdbS-like PH domain-containing protein n=1 Tax=Hyphococcus luteus TaxID=2058213 RepID=A0A2S7K727_9PROT|nr:PH domain-containing protein [Marinicaulis flavus]PQA88258.1 hypothetical protein CW354_08130 [Marinicaulis flavus]